MSEAEREMEECISEARDVFPQEECLVSDTQEVSLVSENPENTQVVIDKKEIVEGAVGYDINRIKSILFKKQEGSKEETYIGELDEDLFHKASRVYGQSEK
ncbi:MAG TPA: hypothetical protein DEP72_00730 [Clostridiales bacterium]|nr:MAG: hypothetical protein A2Y18_02850 [Clostridiales bacterium GWD2_32_19]HCC06677.1 hypothetical protein [Clostridiales bacterium]